MVRGTFSSLDSIGIDRHIRSTLTAFRNETIITHERKLSNLGIKNDIGPCDPNKVVFNYSQVNISFRIKTLLAYGLDFCLPVYKIDFYNYFLSIESLVSRIKFLNLHKDVNFPEFLNKLHAISYKYFYNFNSFKVFSAVFSKEDVDSLKSLSSNDRIVVCKPDKGRGVVIIDKDTYLTQMNKILSDATKFELLDVSFSKYTIKIEDKINNFLRKLKSLKAITSEVYSSLFCSGTNPGILYGLPKIHKADFSSKFQFRPIFAAYNTPCYNISKFLVPYLSPLTKNEYTVDNSYTFVSQLSKVRYSNNYYMTSFDVSNLYTNIPLFETITIILDYLFTDTVDKFIGLSRDLFKIFLEISVTNSFFIFNKKLYRQIDGLGMGLPLAPSFANIFMCYLETKFMSNCPVDFRPIFYRRYVDDTFVLFRNKKHADLFLQYINEQHDNISFTIEHESNGSLSFLDVKVTKSAKSFLTSVHRKPSNSDLTTSFFSFCPFKFKMNSLYSLLSRAYGICSNFKLLNDEFIAITRIFESNGYPKKIIDTTIGNFLSNKFKTVNLDETAIQKLYFSIPYFGYQSEKLRRELSILMHNYFSNISFQFIPTNHFKIGKLFSYKDKIPKSMQSSLIYKFSCARCASGYIGSTTRTLAVRVAEHAGRSFRTNNVLSNTPNSNIYDHAIHCKVDIDLDSFTILNSCNNKIDLHILESLYIHKLKPRLNSSQTAYPLSIVNR